jgi:predicted DNA-binding transcriptional regulator YafY
MLLMERQPLIRIAKIDQCLRSRPFTSLKQLMAELESSRRTVFRDIRALEQMGAPVGYSRTHGGYYYMQGHTFKLPELELTEGDLLALILAEQVISAVDKNYLAKVLEPSLGKLRRMFQKKVRIAPDKVFSFGCQPQSGMDKEVIDNVRNILKAIEEKRKIAFIYKRPSKDKPITLVVEPYHLHFRGKWYVFAWSEYSKDFRTYVIQRMTGLRLCKESFMPRDFAHEKYLGNAWGIIKGKKTEVVLEFSAEQAVFLREKQWHPSQKITKHKNGLMRMTLTVDGLDEVLWWILSYGSNVKVIRPKELAEGIRLEARKMYKQY